jgi:hypothetical protein
MSTCFVCCVLCREQPVRRADQSFRAVLPGVCLIVCHLTTSIIRPLRSKFGYAPRKIIGMV